jgi:hypothetical protein
MLKIKLFLLVAVTAFGASMFAQSALDPVTVTGGMALMLPPPPGKEGGISVQIDGVDATPVRGAPFCAAITTEHTQLFADGNRIHTSEASNMCRDGEGRIRREAGLNLLGAAPQKSGAKLITIIDPVAGFRYLLDPDSKTARRMALPPLGKLASKHVAGEAGVGIKTDKVMIYRTAGAPGPDVFFGNVFVNKAGGPGPDDHAATENLGDQMIEGIHATGTRMTTTIPSGKMGNDQPINVISERWYSPELKVTVMTKHSDPWAGELKTQFSNVNTAEPDSSLFTVPADYKMEDEKAGPFTVMLPPPGPPAQ